MDQQMDDDPTLSWINQDFLEKILTTRSASKIVVSRFNIARAVGKGENYASLLLRVGVEYEEEGQMHKKTSLIMKCLPAGDLIQTFLKEAGAFVKENRLYLETVPAMINLIEKKIPNDKEKLVVPSAFPCERPYTLVLEDLRARNFRMSNRHCGLDMQHACLVLRSLARFHAASVALKFENPSLMEGLEECYFTEEKREMMELFVPNTYNSLASIIEEWKGFEKYGDKLREFGRKCTDFTIMAMQPSTTFLSVLNHGDCWVNNCMFKYNEVTGELEDMAFVDLQMSRYASPALDLLYFTFTSVRREVRINSYRELLMEYHSVMNNTLEALGCGDKCFSMDELEQEIQRLEMFAVAAACGVLSAVVADPDDAFDMEQLSEESLSSGKTNFMEKAMRGRRYREEMQVLLPFFESKGLL